MSVSTESPSMLSISTRPYQQQQTAAGANSTSTTINITDLLTATGRPTIHNGSSFESIACSVVRFVCMRTPFDQLMVRISIVSRSQSADEWHE
jgi:hypothetical protein